MVVVNKGNVGDGNIVHKAIVSYTSLVDKALIDNVVETRDMDMLVVDNVVNSNLADNGKGKRKTVSKGNGIVIRENDNPSFDSDTDSENENDLENQVNPYGNESDMGSETESDESERNGAVFIRRKTQRSLGAVLAVPDISGGCQAYKGAAQGKKEVGDTWFRGNTCNNDKNLSEIQLEDEKEDELVTVVVKVVHELGCKMVVKEIENELLEEVEKLEWWFEQDIDDEGEKDEEDEGGGEV
ncbi:hypothetical protein Tco_1130696 [Tanacetum coccineum]